MTLLALPSTHLYKEGQAHYSNMQQQVVSTANFQKKP